MRNERADRTGTPSTYSTMQRGYAALVYGIRIGTCLDQISDHLALCILVPVDRTRTAVCGIVEGFGAPSISSTNLRTHCDKRLSKLAAI